MKTHRVALVTLILLLTSSSLFAVNDFWLGYHYSVGVSFSIKHMPDTDPPRLMALPMPSYPIESLRAAVQGHAMIQFVVREDGTVTDVAVVSADTEEFGKEAKKAVEGWSFTPGKTRSNGKPASVQMQCRFDFNLDEEAKPSAKTGN